MIKITEKLKYEIVDGSVILYARLLATGEWARRGSCHISVLPEIKKRGLKDCILEGWIKS